MANTRTTQAATLVLVKDLQPMRTTQAVTTVLDYTISQARITQAATLALTAGAPCVTKHAQCWKIVRKDGLTFAFTTHDEPVWFMGLKYLPCDSLMSSASENSTISGNGAVGNMEAKGVLSDDSITESDLANGLFDGATIEIWSVPWNQTDYVEDGPFRINAGVFGQTTQGGVSYTIEMITPGSKLTTRPLLETYTPACRWEFGDGRCPVDKEALKQTSAVTGIEAKNAFQRATYRRFFDTTLGQADNYFDFGELRWLTGANTGIRSEIKSYEGGLVTLWAVMPNSIETGDTYEITPGCDKTEDNHRNKFGLNMVDFGGFPNIPGTDIMTRTPNSKG